MEGATSAEVRVKKLLLMTEEREKFKSKNAFTGYAIKAYLMGEDKPPTGSGPGGE